MKIGLVWHGAFPWDIRIEKFCRSLVKGGNEVVIISRGDGKTPLRETWEGITVLRIYLRIRLLGGFVSRLLSLPLFFNPFWLSRAWAIIQKERIQLLLVRDLPLAFPLGFLGRYLKIPVILDMAENYPAALLAYRNKLYRPFLFGNAWLPRKYEKMALSYMEHVIVVAPEQRERLVKMGYPQERIAVVGNTPDREYLLRLAAADIRDREITGRYILYSGFIDHHRGIRTLVLAFNEIKDACKDCQLVLIGKGKEYGALESLVQYYHLEGRVVFKGWLDFSRIPAYIRRSALCVIPHLKTEHTDTTLPNKIFDYLLFGKPVIVSDAKPLNRIIREFRCGEVFKSGDYLDLSRALLRVLSAPGADYGGRGSELVRTKYNWDNDSRVLLRLIERYG
ncbi:MAG: glycosyltransferase family 4 protein [Endomicrobiales bacterium]